MKFISAVVILALAVYANAGAVRVVDVANRYAPVGSLGPALVNLGSPLGVPVGLGGLAVGSPLGAPLIGLNQGLISGIAGINGLGINGLGINGLGINAVGINGLGITTIGGLSNGLGVGIPAINGLGLGVVPSGIAIGNGLEGQYVAANRGSVHVAPLAGHIQSVNSANLSPAPGTTL